MTVRLIPESCWNTAANGIVFVRLTVDGVSVSGSQGVSLGGSGAFDNHGLPVTWDFTPTAGTHLMKLQWAVSTGTANIVRDSTSFVRMLIQEQVRQNAANNESTGTTG